MPRRRPHRPGRPLAITTGEAEQRVLDAIRSGVPLKQAAAYAGIGERTLHRTLERGRDADDRHQDGEPLDPDDEVCRQLWLRVTRARSEVAVRNVALLAKAATGGYVVRETTRRFRDPVTREVVTETDRQFAPVEWRAAAWLLDHSFVEFRRPPEQVEVFDGGVPGGAGPGGSGDGEEALAVRLREAIALRAAERAALDDAVDAEVLEDA